MKIDIGQLEFIEKKLRAILVSIEAKTGIAFTITSLYRIGDKGVHGTLPLRGVDLRMRDKNVGLEIESYINRTWLYNFENPYKKCALLHGEGANLHLHVQVHSNTEAR